MYGSAWNTGTCLYMIWVGLGCLLQCINSIVWNKNMINRAPVYCDICKSLDELCLESLFILSPTATRFQVALSVAIPACSLCINRRLYKIATMKTVAFTSSEKRRAAFFDLLIGVGIPILQIISGECAWPFTIDRLFTKIQSRVCCFVESLQHIRGLWPLSLRGEYTADLCPLPCMARGDRYYSSLLLW